MAPPVYSEALRGHEIINWLGNASETDPNLLAISEDQIRDVFEADHIYPMLPAAKEVTSSNTKTNAFRSGLSVEPGGSSDNFLYLCQTAKFDETGNFLTLEKENIGWLLGRRRYSTVYVRQAYEDHWELIQDHFRNSVNKREPFVISGSPGVGKSVEAIYLLTCIFEMSPTNPPPILYFPDVKWLKTVVFFKGFFFNIPVTSTLPRRWLIS
jgi:hypothetical protein